MSHYYKTDNNLKAEDIKIDFEFSDQSFIFFSNSGIFSKNHVDQGSKILLEYLSGLKLNGKLLDIGCGYGVLGIVLKRLFPELSVTLIDINERALKATKENCKVNNVECYVAKSDVYQNISSKYDFIITNPPIRAGRAVVFTIIEQSKQYLSNHGQLILVVGKKQGALSLLSFIEECYDNSEICLKKQGFYVLRAKNLKN